MKIRDELIALEHLLACAHSVIGEKIDDKPPGPNDDAQAEYNEERLILAARAYALATNHRDLT